MKPVSNSTRQLHEALFEHLDVPEVPKELASSKFLERIYERAIEAEASELAPVFDSITPLVAPEDACWQEVEETPELRGYVEAVLPGPDRSQAAPGWMWSRIREDLRRETGKLRRKSLVALRMRYAAAAVVVLSFGLGTTFLLSDGTNKPAQIVFREDPGLRTAADGLFGEKI